MFDFLDSIVPVCSDSSIPKVSPGVNCVIPENVNSVFQMLQKLHPMLIQRAVAAACENTKEPAFISDSEVVDIFASKNVVRIFPFSINSIINTFFKLKTL